MAEGRHRRQAPAGLALAPAALADGASPDMIAAPARPGAHGGGELTLEARAVPGGGQVLPVFSSVGKLVEALGPSQPWAVLPLERAMTFAGAAGVEHVVLDPVLSPGTWKWSPADLADIEQWRQWRG